MIGNAAPAPCTPRYAPHSPAAAAAGPVVGHHRHGRPPAPASSPPSTADNAPCPCRPPARPTRPCGAPAGLGLMAAGGARTPPVTLGRPGCGPGPSAAACSRRGTRTCTCTCGGRSGSRCTRSACASRMPSRSRPVGAAVLQKRFCAAGRGLAAGWYAQASLRMPRGGPVAARSPWQGTAPPLADHGLFLDRGGCWRGRRCSYAACTASTVGHWYDSATWPVQSLLCPRPCPSPYLPVWAPLGIGDRLAFQPMIYNFLPFSGILLLFAIDLALILSINGHILGFLTKKLTLRAHGLRWVYYAAVTRAACEAQVLTMSNVVGSSCRTGAGVAVAGRTGLENDSSNSSPAGGGGVPEPYLA